MKSTQAQLKARIHQPTAKRMATETMQSRRKSTQEQLKARIHQPTAKRMATETMQSRRKITPHLRITTTTLQSPLLNFNKQRIR
jgi:hypothetical protein